MCATLYTRLLIDPVWFSSVFSWSCCCPVAKSCLTLSWPHGLRAAHQASPSFSISRSLLTLMSIELVMPSNHLILCCSPPPPAFYFFWHLSLCIRWSKYWSFSFSISPSNEYSGLISFRIDWFALLAVQGTLKSLLQHHSSRAWILQRSAFFTVQLSHPYMITGKTMALTL